MIHGNIYICFFRKEMIKISATGLSISVLYILLILIFFSIVFSVLLFMIGIKALKALQIYIDNNQNKNSQA